MSRTAGSLHPEWTRTSWVEGANQPDSGFPLQSLPYCVFAADGGPHIGVGIGSSILDLKPCCGHILAALDPALLAACQAESLNQLIACGPAPHAALRERLVAALDTAADETTRNQVRAALVPMDTATLMKPVAPANYTDFYASLHHATHVGRLFRPGQPLLPNYQYVPIGYHGRASSIVVSGTPIRRPTGQLKPPDGASPEFAPTRFLDYELEVAIYIAQGNPLGKPIPIGEAGEHAFGISLLNDWSARDMQSWESQPLGPFLAKSFATTVSPWVVPMAALAPFRCTAARPSGDPPPLPYLASPEDRAAGAIDLTLEAYLLTPAMRARHSPPYRLSRVSLRELYWTPAQLIAHHSSNGCNLLAGDLLATGTVSGPEDDSAGCLLELTTGGRHPLELPNGETRRGLEDGDEVILRGVCRREGFPEVTLGECRGLVIPAAYPE